jgi:hypothetical protein
MFLNPLKTPILVRVIGSREVLECKERKYYRRASLAEYAEGDIPQRRTSIEGKCAVNGISLVI